ncbi:hypothetical protein H2199_001970 [Coniosporium tulheliwenetii]|uniref:Uncharacterized protein n=1 Tax=Coniosporium tulheliwenetii TaxID=3383036 RepID=A0ACC2ZH52_9PEZI|nr:hypothetical protein H2199_001970 [Cladosporium sp. JES 115]
MSTGVSLGDLLSEERKDEDIGRNEAKPTLQIPLPELGKRTSEDDTNSEFEIRAKKGRIKWIERKTV